ncbi:unnamed protein product [Chrysodeixis includens]|uniref:Uncharacterized protein n=1 Tax=Chrysodeixis includens TaxID=689277 RepID=A0A9N8PXK8_CHRIL|nr:unnamed protein product [Chrysodeixis includens]
MKKSCMPKNDVTEEEIGDIEKGKFIETRNVMCYIACVYTMTQVVKNNKLSYEAVIKQVDVMFPAEMRTAVKAAAAHCKDIKQVGRIEQGVFIENHNVMCYISCVYKNFQVMKNDRLDLNSIMKQVDILYPPDMREPVKKAVVACKDIQQVGDISKGKFIEERNVMCYIACVYKMGQTIKGNTVNYDMMIKQVEMIFPADIKAPVKEAIESCRPVAKKYKDVCEVSYWTAKCIYEHGPENFLFP